MDVDTDGVKDHAARLERLCLSALKLNDWNTAYIHADRRCRVFPNAKAPHHVMRADILRHLGEDEGAIAALEKAIELDPYDYHANRRLMMWGEIEARSDAALRVLDIRQDPPALLEAMDALFKCGHSEVASVRIFDDFIKGWVAWNGQEVVECRLYNGVDTVAQFLRPSEKHLLKGGPYQHATSFRLPRLLSGSAHRLQLEVDGRPVLRGDRAPNWTSGAIEDDCPIATRPSDVTVIIPVFADFAATSACIDTLRSELGPGRRAVLIDDASLDPKITALMDELAREPGFIVFRNLVNTGFANSVNRALRIIGDGDVLILNADTLLPDRTVTRLFDASRSSDDIGTLTPLSNNGEFTSFPIPNQFNDIPSSEEIRKIDAAASVNQGELIDLPNGIGFCLYVTRSCLNAVGELSSSFGRGYFEDVDFCLRAREKGFRNVCVPSIYVGHLGSRSFKKSKRALVVRNLDIIRQRFSSYEAECAAFLVADPLKEPRAAIERELLLTSSFARLIVFPAGALEPMITQRARGLSGRGHRILLLRVGPGPTVYFNDPDGSSPQSLAFSIGEGEARSQLLAYLQRLSVERLEIAGPGSLGTDLLETVLQLDHPLDLLIADDSLATLRESTEDRVGETGHQPVGQLRAKLLERAVSFVAPDGRAKRFAKAHLTTFDKVVLQSARSAGPRSVPAMSKCTDAVCGIVPLGAPQEFTLLQQLAGSLAGQPGLRFVYFGETLNDELLMASGNLHVTGESRAKELPDALRHHGVSCLFLPSRELIFGVPIIELARRSGLPMAYFRWAFDDRPRPADLALDCQDTDSSIRNAFVAWLRERAAG